MDMNDDFRTGRTAAPTFSRRKIIVGLAVAPVVAALLDACGDKTQETADTSPPTSVTTPPTQVPTTGVPTTEVPSTGVPTTEVPSTEVPTTEVPTTDVPAGQIEYPHDADSAVIRIEIEGGFVPPGFDFRQLPSVLIAGDGRSYSEGVTTEEYPGPLVRPIQVRTIDEAGIQRLLALAEEAGLLGAAPDYAGGENIADAPDTVVTISANGTTYVHRAYALGIEGPGTGRESSPARQTLHEFVEQLQDLDSAVGDGALGEYTVLETKAYRMRATGVQEIDIEGLDPAPARVNWPDSVGIALRDAEDCALVSAEQVGTLFAESRDNTVFTEGDAETASLYQLAVIAQLPGDAEC